jgi:hypothetical protein
MEQLLPQCLTLSNGIDAGGVDGAFRMCKLPHVRQFERTPLRLFYVVVVAPYELAFNGCKNDLELSSKFEALRFEMTRRQSSFFIWKHTDSNSESDAC